MHRIKFSLATIDVGIFVSNTTRLNALLHGQKPALKILVPKESKKLLFDDRKILVANPIRIDTFQKQDGHNDSIGRLLAG